MGTTVTWGTAKYKDVHMTVHSYNTILEVKPLAAQVVNKLSVDQWRLGVDAIVYGSGNDGIGWHQVNLQVDSIVVCIILLTTKKLRPLLIKPIPENAGHLSYKPQMRAGTSYHNNPSFKTGQDQWIFCTWSSHSARLSGW